MRRSAARASVISLAIGLVAVAAVVTPPTAARATVTPTPSLGVTYVANGPQDTITAYDSLADGNVVPILTIGGDRTGLKFPVDVVVDSVGTVYALNATTDTVVEFAAGAEGNTAPTRTIGGPLTGLASSVALAIDSSGTLYVSSYANNRITAYAPGANGNVAPARTIDGALTGLNGPRDLAVDSGGSLYVNNWGSNSIAEFAAGANGNISPARTLGGALTTLNGPRGLAIGPDGTLFVVNGFGLSVTEYSPGVEGNTAPAAVISGAATGFTSSHRASGVAVDAAGTIYVATSGDGQVDYLGSVREFGVGASGNASPVRVVSGPLTGLIASVGIAVGTTPVLVTSASKPVGWTVTDTATLYGGSVNPVVGGSITFTLYGPGDPACSGAGVLTSIRSVNGNGSYTSAAFEAVRPGTYRWRASYGGDASNHAVGPDACGAAAETVDSDGLTPGAGITYVANGSTITEYTSGADGNTPAKTTIGGALTGLNSAEFLALGGDGTLYAGNTMGSSITEYAPGASGNVAPVRTIIGSATGLSRPSGIAVDAAGLLYVADSPSNTVKVFAPGADGNTSPVRSLSGVATGLDAPEGLALDASGTLYVANTSSSAATNSITEYASGVTGNVAPTRTISGPTTLLNAPISLTIDAVGTLYVACEGPPGGIIEYAAGADGNVAPVRSITGIGSGLLGPVGVAVDASGTLYATVPYPGRVDEYPAAIAGVAPARLRSISGPATGLQPIGIAVGGKAPDMAWVVGGDGGLYTKNGAQPGYTGLGGVLLASAAVVTVPDAAFALTTLYIALGADHRLYVRNRETTWQPLITSPHQCFDNPAAAVTGAGPYSLTVVCEGGDRGLYLWTATVSATALPSISTGAQSLGGAVLAGPAVAQVNGVLTVFAEGTDHFLYSRPISPSAFTQIPGECIGHPAAGNSLTATYLACQGLDGALYYAMSTGSGWGGFHSAGGQLINGPGIAVTTTGVAVYVEGTNGHLFHTAITLDSVTSSAYVDDGGGIQFGAAAAGRYVP